MTYKIRYTPQAQKDLDTIWDDVQTASMDYDIADKYVDDLLNDIAKRKKSPKTGIPLYYRGLFTGYYSVNFKAYNAFYRIHDYYMEVARILPSKSDYLKVLFGE